MALSLRRRILWWSVASTLVIVLAAFLLVDGIIRNTIGSDQRENLVAGTRLVSQLQASAVDEYLDRTASLATAPTLRAAVETGDPSTIRENLDALLAGAATDWIAVLSPAGELLAATDSTPSLERAAPLVESSRFFDSAELWPLEGRLEQVHASGIFFGSTQLGVVLGGIAIDEARVAQMEAGTQQRVAFLAGRDVVAADSTIGERARADLARVWSVPASAVTDASDDGHDVREFELDGERYMGTSIPLPDGRGGDAGRLVTFRSLDAAMQPARTVRYALLGVAAAGLLFAFGASYVLARRVTSPVNRLLAETVRLGSGDLGNPVEPEHDDELGRLALGFETMRRSLKGAQEELVRSERLSAVGRAASAIVHDIKQPVTVIQGHVELLQEDWADEAARNEDLGTITRELGRLNGMMDEVLDFARGAESLRLTSGSVRELLDEVARAVRPLLKAGDVRLTVEHGYEGTWTLDFARTHRLLENLVRNAIGALRGSGAVTLCSRIDDGVLELEVEDDGPGIPAEIRETLFEPFVTHGKREGTGLGLAIVKAFTERQGGTVRFETSDAGTRFIVRFPGRRLMTASGIGAGPERPSSAMCAARAACVFRGPRRRSSRSRDRSRRWRSTRPTRAG